MKQLTTEATRLLVPRAQQQALLDGIFQWCLEEYYGPRTGAVSSRRREDASPANG